MTWPFDKPPDKDPTQVGDKDKPNPDAKVEKTPAELIAEALSPLRDSFEKMNSRFDAIEQNMVKKPEPRENAERIEPVSVLDDENAAFAQRIGPVLLQQFEMSARLNRNEVKNEYISAGYGDLWGQYEKEINQVLDNTPLAGAEGKPLRGDMQYIRNVVDMVFGREARKAGMRFDGKSKGFFLETGSAGDGPGKGSESDGMTEAQRRVFARMKVPSEDAKKTMAKLRFIQ